MRERLLNLGVRDENIPALCEAARLLEAISQSAVAVSTARGSIQLSAEIVFDWALKWRETCQVFSPLESGCDSFMEISVLASLLLQVRSAQI